MCVRGKWFRASAAAVLALALSSYPASAQVASGDQVSNTSPLSAIKIFNFGKVNAHYYRGAQPKGQDYEALKALGVKLIIDLQKDSGDAQEIAARNAGIRYVNIKMTTRVAPTPDNLKEFLSLVNDPANQPVYVHCREGRHRTGVMTAVYRMVGDSWTPDQAFQEMKDYRFGASFLHPEFKRYVYAFTPSVVPALVVPALAVGAPATATPMAPALVTLSGATASTETSPAPAPAQ